MLIVPGWSKDNPNGKAYEIGEDYFKYPELSNFVNEVTGETRKRYVAQSTAIILIEGSKRIDLYAGREVSEKTIKNTLNYLIKQEKEVRLAKCETLSVLGDMDNLVTVSNQFINFNKEPDLNDSF